MSLLKLIDKLKEELRLFVAPVEVACRWKSAKIKQFHERGHHLQKSLQKILIFCIRVNLNKFVIRATANLSRDYFTLITIVYHLYIHLFGMLIFSDPDFSSEFHI
jgi:hypothetical protein